MDGATTDADLVIAGYGAAGAAAAITAADLGARVVILEKQAADRHTPSIRMSSGAVMAVDDFDRAMPYLTRCAGGLVPDDVTRAWAEKAVTLLGWMKASGVEVELARGSGGEHPGWAGANAVGCYRHALRNDGLRIDYQAKTAADLKPGYGLKPPHTSRLMRAGNELWAGFTAAVARRPIEIRWNAAAHRLIRGENGRIIGIEYRQNGNLQRVHGRRGVLLATGGFEFDEELKRQYLKAPMHFYANPGNSGDGLRMAQAVGADLWHMNLAVGRGIGHFLDETGNALNFVLLMVPGGYAITDRFGKRFAKEYSQATLGHAFYNEMLNFDGDEGEYTRIPSYWLFDRRRIEGGPLTSPVTGTMGVGLYDWSTDNRREIARGWVIEAASVEEAARKAGLKDPAAAAREIAAYNAACATGEDRLGRPKDSLIPLDQPPFYCVPLYPGGSNTCGGPRRDARARILDVFGEPVPGLFGAGELGQAIGLLYPGGGAALSEAISFGRIAAEEALRGNA
jgi:succinate dehydrogenase/fumarate reductase flavoprotein subunit